MSQHIRFISAGAGSGKTYRIAEDLQKMLANGSVQPSGVMATTFTRRAATELRERIRQKLLADGNATQAAQMGQALIGTVNGVCGELLGRFAFEAGLSPDQKVLEEEHGKRMFGVALEGLLADDPGRIPKLNAMARRLGRIDDNYHPDWRGEVMTVANAARANNMSSEQIRAWAKESTDELLAMFPPPHAADRELQQELLRAVTSAIERIDLEVDATEGTEKYVGELRKAQAALSQERLAWSEWVKLAKASPTKKSAELAETVQMIAGDFEKNPLLHADIREFCSEVFDLAADSMEAYQQMKAQQGMLDFVDQEQRLYKLLDHPHVKDALADELQVLFVDEFQDTSPIQLALFMKLAALADQVVLVGDIKQAIYGFRGSDPQLMQAVLRGVTEGGGTTDLLENSWRSRPPLVAYVNQVFVQTFAESIPPDQVTLVAKRKEESGAAAVSHWQLAGSNVDKRSNDLALGIQGLIDEGYPVTDKGSGESRPVDYGDIAVLCRTNDRLIATAGACAKAGIPVAFKRPDVLKTPEGALVMACLRRLADGRDSLASAEIRTLIYSESPEEWLADRLDFVRNEEKPWQWGETGDTALPELQALAEARRELPLLTPSEALELALVKGRTREAVIAWGPTANHTRHRLRNIDVMLEYAAKYEDHCDMVNVAATVPGLILWFYELANNKQDWQAEAGDGRAVTLVTHHGAKGLEWPVVICVDLESKIRPRLWGLTVLQRTDGFDVNEPLAGRRLRYWPWPFGQQSAGIPVRERSEKSPVGVAAHTLAIEEARRLLYVSMTRARDHLIIAMPTKRPTGEWLETLAADWLLPKEEELMLPDGSRIPTDFKELEALEGWTRPVVEYEARWVTAGIGADGLLNRNLSPSAAAPCAGIVVGEVVELGNGIQLDGVSDVPSLGQAIHGIIAAEINSPDDKAGSRAARVLEEWGFAGSVEPAAAVAAAHRFIDWAKTTFEPVAWHVEHPITYVLETGQVAQGFIDLLLETKDGWVIVDHKATPRPRTEWKDIAEGYSGQLAMYKDAVEAVSDKPVLSQWIHLPVGGGVIAVN